ncbi:TIGR02281 family clan AA aspartic protease [Nitratireductor basaltis]|uniref:TIGR02281 family clan AA aspartic protease n=1 Tax=Nitratireductor basaltis TaxID=472175 RepID=A0A084U5T2_9HYPH|nr:TIGR02281 family clan AA aspartic protease [Nitratireductor basaltis]KFB08318.1 hypothetical protein EL18_02568 [Nitratireductor basaltis]
MRLSKIIFLSSLVGVAVALPMVHRDNPELFSKLVSHFYKSSATGEESRMTVHLSRAELEREQENLLGRKIRIPSDAKGHFFAEFKLNGARIPGMVDTGATMVAINTSTARKVGIRLQESDFNARVNTANGMTRAAVATLEGMAIGKIYVPDVEVLVLDDHALDHTLVGMSFLSELKRFQIERGSLILEQ